MSIKNENYVKYKNGIKCKIKIRLQIICKNKEKMQSVKNYKFQNKFMIKNKINYN